MSPTIFNIMVDAVIRHWRHVHRPDLIEELALFFADDGMLTGTSKERVQASLDIITRGFASLGLEMNARKTKFMVMKGGEHRLRLSTLAYSRKVTHEGDTHRARQREKVQCLRCGAIVGRSYLKKHQFAKTCLTASKTYAPPTPVRARVAAEQMTTPIVEPQQYTSSIPWKHDREVACPVPGCPFIVRANAKSKRVALRMHFRQRHMEDSIMIEEEGQLPQCNRCGLFVKNANSGAHHETSGCQKFAVRRDKLIKQKRQAAATEVSFSINGEQIERVAQFRYLGRILDENDDDTHASFRQLARARTKWNRIGRVLRSEGMKPRAMGYFYKAVVQAILLYGSETWVVSDAHLRHFRSFHSRIGRHLTGRHIRLLEDGSWFCPPTVEVLEDAGLQTIDEYINRRRQTVRSFTRHRPLYEACRQSTALSTNINKAVWWQLEV